MATQMRAVREVRPDDDGDGVPVRGMPREHQLQAERDVERQLERKLVALYGWLSGAGRKRVLANKLRFKIECVERQLEGHRQTVRRIESGVPGRPGCRSLLF